ncbi:MAG TPA: N-acetylneuraminate synthase family protein [Candidatus Gastranaerophilales bacterium]|nr:N-acetylneuraminate synthase family protein [Candidatus Gastranaerophilales bacterium]
MLDKLDKCYIIAEIGGNFTTYEEAIKLIDAAKYAGVDAIKLQTYKAETISSRNAFFDMENTGKISQYEYFKKYELSKELHKKIFDYADSKGLDWFSTPSHRTDVDMLNSLGVKVHKIGADDATNIPFLKYVAATKLTVLLSTGMCNLEEVKKAVNAILEQGNDKIVIFHTVSGYPTYPEYVNLNVINTFKKEFPEIPIGFSDHTLTPMACIAAATMGAQVLEKHFTLDKNAEGPDHMISATPDEMKYIVDSVREIEKMKGSSVKMPVGAEIQNRINNRKSIVAIKNIKKGEQFSLDNIDIKRPGNGIEPEYLTELTGKIALKDLKEDELITWSDFS